METKEIEKLVGEVAKANLKSRNVLGVHSESSTDSEGRESLHITIVVTPSSATSITKSDVALTTLVDVRNRLFTAGEQRFPIIEYSTEKEMKAGGGP